MNSISIRINKWQSVTKKYRINIITTWTHQNIKKRHIYSKIANVGPEQNYSIERSERQSAAFCSFRIRKRKTEFRSDVPFYARCTRRRTSDLCLSRFAENCMRHVPGSEKYARNSKFSHPSYVISIFYTCRKGARPMIVDEYCNLKCLETRCCSLTINFNLSSNSMRGKPSVSMGPKRIE